MGFWTVKPLVGLDAAMFVLSLAGMAINGLLLYVTYAYCRAKAIDITLIQIIALLDSWICSFMVFSIALRYGVGSSVLDTRGWWCRMSAIAYSGFVLQVLVCAALLALVRYLAIVRGVRINNRGFLTLLYTVVAGVSVLFSVLAFNCESVLPPSGLYCTPRFTGPSVVARAGGYITLGLLAFSLVTIPASYLCITLHYQRVMRGLKESYSLWRLQRSLYSLVLVVVCYTATILPEFVLVALSATRVVERSNVADGIVILMLTSITLVNPLFSLLLHNDIYREFLDVLGISQATEYSLE